MRAPSLCRPGGATPQPPGLAPREGMAPVVPVRSRSNRADITGQRGPRHAVARPVSTITTPPQTAAARQGVPVMTACPAAPAMISTCAVPPEEVPLVVDPPGAPDAACARAAASTAEAWMGTTRRDRRPRAEGREHDPGDAPGQRPGGDDRRQAGQRRERERARQRDKLLTGDGDVLRGQRVRSREDRVRPGLPQGQDDEPGPGRAGHEG